MACARYSKHQPRQAGRYRIVEAQSLTVNVDKDDVPVTVSIHHRTEVSEPKNSSHTLEQEVSQHSTAARKMQYTLQQQTDRESEDVVQKKSLRDKYAVENILGCKGCSQEQRYIFEWYGYGPGYDTLDIAQNISCALSQVTTNAYTNNKLAAYSLSTGLKKCTRTQTAYSLSTSARNHRTMSMMSQSKR